MSSSSKTNIKTVILATIKAPLAALYSNVEAMKKSIFDHTDTQDDSITDLQAHVAELQTTITNVNTEILKFNKIVEELQNNAYTKEQVTQLTNRVRELDWICSQLYDIVYELKLQGTSDKPMPDFEHPIVTRAELLTIFKEEQNIPEDQELTPEQQEQFENFIVQWFIDNPGHVFDENLES